MLRDTPPCRREAPGQRERSGFALLTLAATLLLLPVALLVAAYATPDPIRLGPLTVVGPRCRNTAVFHVTYTPPPGPGIPGTTFARCSWLNDPAGSQLTFSAVGTDGVWATNGRGNPPLRTVVGSRVWVFLGLGIALR